MRVSDSYLTSPNKTKHERHGAKGQNCVSDFPLQMQDLHLFIESDVYNKKKIQMFGVNMTFISSREVKKCIFHSCRNIHFFTSLDKIKVIFTPNI